MSVIRLRNTRCHLINMMLFLAFTLLLLSDAAASKSIIKSLPGFDGNLPFVLETGYIGVGELEAVQLFYYFIESERSPKDDPLVLWLTGGPGCSALSGIIYEIGPLSFDYAKSSGGGKPVFALNPYSWTKIANIIFVDAPVGTGFSYSTTGEGYHVSDTISAAETYEFLRKWLVDHPKFLTNPLYVAGDSFSGIVAPIIVQEISDGNEVGRQPTINLKGYVLGNPLTDHEIDTNSIVPFALLKALISDKLYESFMKNCKGEYLNPDQSNASCMEDILAIKECIGKVYTGQILEPTCKDVSPKPVALKWDPRFLIADDADILLPSPRVPGPWCRNYNHVYIYGWANDETVRDALHIRKGTIKDWRRCNKTLAYSYNVESTVDYHRNLTKKPYRSLIYSGDHDMTIPYIGTHEWIESLNLTIKYDWEPWFVDGQVAGYAMLYADNVQDYITYDLTFATVKGGGHTASEYRPEQCFAMMDRWFDYYPL
uniref:Serine carboxypeptidase-like 18 n=1 Tax=Populus trichocarpa TaxID=3694 RepID=A0A2K2C5I0_POPTR|eukprot:XP_024458640.1 serine carboxypeptidase-like 18 isoform X1 [Populus trichocarpa]